MIEALLVVAGYLCGSLPFGRWLVRVFRGKPWPVIGFAVAAALAVLFLHRSNIRKLRSGTETKMQLRRRLAG